MMEIAIVSLLLFILILLGVLEQRKNTENINKIPIRVNVNGIRGKSTVTRLISAVLAEEGYRNIGKTTGTAPRMIYGKNKKEKEIIRSPKGVSIGEQIKVINEAAFKNVDSLVCECMAINPNYQQIYQEKMIQANIGVIVNVLEDHLDEMGPTTDQIAQAFSSTIPYDGKLIIPNDEYVEYFKEIARQRNTEVFVADESEIPQGYRDKFEYVVFPNNISIPLAFAKAVGIPKEVALKGMLRANPDPGALIIDDLNVEGKHCIFVNAFAANDPTSALDIFNTVYDEGYVNGCGDRPLIVFNSRGDRVDRTEQFAADWFPLIDREIDLLVMGTVAGPIVNRYNSGKLKNINKLINYENKTGAEVKQKVFELMNDRLVFCVGNIHGEGEAFLESISEWGSDLYRQKANL